MLCWVAVDRNPQLEEIVSNFEITNTRIFSVTGRTFQSKTCRLTDNRFEALMFINCNKYTKHGLFFFNQCFEVFVAVEELTGGKRDDLNPWPTKCKNHPSPT